MRSFQADGRLVCQVMDAQGTGPVTFNFIESLLRIRASVNQMKDYYEMHRDMHE